MAKEVLEIEVKSNVKGAITDVDKLGKSVKTTAERYAELNEEIAIQNEEILIQEEELIRLKDLQDSIPEGEWFTGQGQLADDINEVTSEIKAERDALKDLKREQREAADIIKDSTDAYNTQVDAATRLGDRIRVMGVSLGGVRRTIKGVIPMFNLLFSSIKTGIMSTGIGAIVLALIAIGTSMKSSVAGGKAFKAMMSALGAVTKVLTDSLTFLGDAMLSVFGFDSSTDAAVLAAENLAQVYKDLGREMDSLNSRGKQHGKQQLELKQISDNVTKSEYDRLKAARESFELDESNNDLKLINLKKQEDATRKAASLAFDADWDAYDNFKLTQDEREKIATTMHEANTKRSNAITAVKQLEAKQLLNQINLEKEIDNIKSFNISKDEKRTQDNQQRNEKAAAKQLASDREVANAERALLLKTQKIKDEIEYEGLETQEAVERAKLKNTYDRTKLEIENSIASQNIIDEALKELKLKYEGDIQEIQDKSDERVVENEIRLQDLRDENYLAGIEDEKKKALETLRISYEADLEELSQYENFLELKKELDIQYGRAKKALDVEELKWSDITTKQKIKMAGDAFGQMSEIMGKETKAGKAAAIVQAGISTYLGAQEAYTSMAKVPVVGPALGVIAAGAAIAMGLKNIQAIRSGEDPSVSSSSTPSTSSAPPSSEMMSGSFELTGGQEVEPVQAYVVSDQITENQNALEIIRRRATI